MFCSNVSGEIIVYHIYAYKQKNSRMEYFTPAKAKSGEKILIWSGI